MIVETLKLNPDTRPEEEIKIDRARINGMHEGIKQVIREIDDVISYYNAISEPISSEFNMLRNKLGRQVYKYWPRKD